jgi:hypothetical protein
LGGWNIYPGIDMPGYKYINPNGFFIRPKPVFLKGTPGLSCCSTPWVWLNFKGLWNFPGNPWG